MGTTRKYEGKHVEVRYDSAKCIHAAECGRGLPAVFDPARRPWVNPDGADAQRVIETVLRCPTGALQAYRAGREMREGPGANVVTVAKDGPLYLRGEIVMHAADGSTREESRVALCRCGASKKKPLCDGSHAEVEFRADGGSHAVARPAGDGTGPLEVTIAADGPLVLKGVHTLDAGKTEERTAGALCRCGHAASKPHCDGSHKAAGFRG
jgi:CDGSH-type Zn-finger protein/uncharacterized Fe-S cluster protein YjdI